MSQDTRRADLERNLTIAEQSGYAYVAEQNRRLLAAMDAREAAPEVAPTNTERARALRSLVWSWLPEESMPCEGERPTPAESRVTVLATLEQVREAQQFLANWTDRLVRLASENGASNPDIGAALGVGKNAIWKRLQREPGK
ncbi:hypothetical protein Cme02nite_69480 [Catellatospora methionotrophica]|uniref:Uncharacterized protein n=1 Tax=Catellatospora methionotrophica TaxID=121620 RepID=A0A8J3PI74_9ACTN|nr:hypothetical protein [Catellatospora methionotrophica]GIG18616.1 hypothetical protein Cme02nite_69480 [Catellatospora methionotrophica]